MSRPMLLFSRLLLVPLLAVPGCQAINMLKLAEQEHQYVGDRRLQARLAGEFAAEPRLAGARIDAEVFLLDVTLIGHADPAQRALALAIADGIDEIGQLDDRMQPAAAAGSNRQGD